MEKRDRFVISILPGLGIAVLVSPKFQDLSILIGFINLTIWWGKNE
jgi:hypothetical protein